MAENKTKATEASVESYLSAIQDEARRKDCEDLAKLITRATRQQPKMWGSSIVGFGSYHYKYESGREGDSLLTGFSPRKQNLTLYLGPGLDNKALMAKLGKHTTGKGCLYIKKLNDIDRSVLRDLIAKSVEEMRKRHPTQ